MSAESPRQFTNEDAQRSRAESRARVAKFAAEGRGREALAEGASALGLDVSKPIKARLVGFNGIPLDSPKE